MTLLTETLLDSLTDEYAATRDSFDRDDLVHLLCDLRELRAGLAEFTKDVERDLMALADTKRFVVDGIGEITVRKATTRREWDHSGLTRKLVALALDERILDEETGEFEPAYEAVARVLGECARPEWRVTPLRARGVPIDEYCVETDGGYQVQLPSRRV